MSQNLAAQPTTPDNSHHHQQSQEDDELEEIDITGRTPRFVRLHKAYHLAFRKGSESWTDNDLRSCFPHVYSQNPNLLKTMREIVIGDVRKRVKSQEATINRSYNPNVADAVDTLHNVVTEAKERIRSGSDEPLKDAWDADTDPNAVVRAQSVPLFRAEIERVKAQIAEVEARCTILDQTVRQNNVSYDVALERIRSIVGRLDNVRAETSAIPKADFEEWALEVDATGQV